MEISNFFIHAAWLHFCIYLLMSIQKCQWSIVSDQLHWHVLAELPGHWNNSLWRSCWGAGPVCRHVCADPECCLQSAVCADSEIPAERTCVCAAEPGYHGETTFKSMSQSLLPYQMIKIWLYLQVVLLLPQSLPQRFTSPLFVLFVANDQH